MKRSQNYCAKFTGNSVTLPVALNAYAYDNILRK